MSEGLLSMASWRRLVADGVVILGSILLAFGIDAWWDGYRERARESGLLLALSADFAESRPLLEARRELARRMAEGNGRLLDHIHDVEEGAVVSVPDTLIFAVISGPTYEPNMSALDAALASGETDLITSEELRAELATWRRLLADTSEDELEVRRITNEQVVPQLARSLALGPYFDRTLAWAGAAAAGSAVGAEGEGGARSQSAVLTSSFQLEGALAVRKFFVDFSASDLSALLACLDRITVLLERLTES